jgi:hypothetical protein
VPSRWEVPLAGPVAAAIPLTAPHAVVAGWLDDPATGPGQGPAEVARSGHGDPVKKWACGPLRAVPSGAAGTTLGLQVRLLDDGLAGRLQAATAPGAAVRLGACHYRVAGPVRMTASAAWPDLRRWAGARAWQVRFVTPACARRRNRTFPLLSPETLARGLADRWQRLDPATAPDVPWRGAGPVWVSDLDGHSEVQVLARRLRRDGQSVTEEEIISGLTGRVRYVCDHGSDADAACFGALLAFAAFAGAGSHTAYGFGVTVPEPTWQPPTMQAAGL